MSAHGLCSGGPAPCAWLRSPRWSQAAALLCTAPAPVCMFLLLHCVGALPGTWHPAPGPGAAHPVRQQCLSCCLLSGYTFNRLPPCSNKPKLVILDECDAMTKDAQFALRRGGVPIRLLLAAVRLLCWCWLHLMGAITLVLAEPIVAPSCPTAGSTWPGPQSMTAAGCM